MLLTLDTLLFKIKANQHEVIMAINCINQTKQKKVFCEQCAEF